MRARRSEVCVFASSVDCRLLDASKEVKQAAGDSGVSERAVSTGLSEQLTSARFRFINEKLYNCTGDEAEHFFAEGQPNCFAAPENSFCV